MNMKLKLINLFLIGLTFQYKINQNFDKIINNVIAQYEDVQSIQYQLLYRYKCFDCDTLKSIQGQINVIVFEQDSIFKKLFLYDCIYTGTENEKYIRYYNGEKLYSLPDTPNNRFFIEFNPYQ